MRFASRSGGVLALAFVAVINGCGEDNGGTLPAGGAGGVATGGAAGSSGRSGAAGRVGGSAGASAGKPDRGGSDSGNVGGEAGQAAGDAGAGGSNEGGVAGTPTEVPGFCSRLTAAATLAGEVAVDFDFASAADCRVAGIPFLYVLAASNERVTFLNQLTVFNYALWGCANSAFPDEFALIYLAGLAEDPRPITTADIDALIEDYLAVAKPRLALGQGELARLDAQLHLLAEHVASVESNDYSRSNCNDGAGAAGAAGSDAGGAAGAAGAGASGEGGR